MSRVPFATKIDEDLKNKLHGLSEDTRIPQSKLLDEAIQDLLNKYNKK
jgi:predicted transcriptional regulator